MAVPLFIRIFVTLKSTDMFGIKKLKAKDAFLEAQLGKMADAVSVINDTIRKQSASISDLLSINKILEARIKELEAQRPAGRSQSDRKRPYS